MSLGYIRRVPGYDECEECHEHYEAEEGEEPPYICATCRQQIEADKKAELYELSPSFSVREYVMLCVQEGSTPRRWCPNGHVVEWWCGWPIYPMKVGKSVACFVCGWIEADNASTARVGVEQ